MQQKYIEIRGARVHNLKNINIRIPRNKLVVISGLSGSGKSTLAFDTLFAEGQRRYVESLSSYARQFLGRINKPETDSITGIPPAISIEQKVNIRNPRSTVGTSTEIYDYMKLLYTKIGRTYSPLSGEEVRIDSITDIVNYFASRPRDEKIMILAPMVQSKTLGFVEQLTLFIEEGFSRVVILTNTAVEMIDIKKYITYYDAMYSKKRENTYLLIDRISVADEEEYLARVADSAQTAFDKSDGQCCLYVYATEEEPFLKKFSSAFETDGLRFEKPDENLFSFNSPTGACPQCRGYGKVEGIDENLVIPNKSLSIYENAIACWRGESMSAFRDQLIYAAPKFDFPIHRPYYQLNQQERELLWTGNRWFDGLTAFFNMLEANRYKIQYRVMLSRYKGKTPCPSCHGSRLCREAACIRISDKNITELVTMPITQLKEFFQNLTLTEYETQIARRTLSEITVRIQCLIDLGLGYLTLDRLSNTLSGGESQRVNLSVSLGSSLVGSLYILDEPSVGLHPRDSARMVKVLKDLRDLGNTVVVVEHEEEIMHAADEIIDIGPLSGRFGGEIVFQGKLASATDADRQKSLTLKYLAGTEKIEVPTIRRRLNQYIEIMGAKENNLKNINVKIPLNGIVAITGVSGSGKSTLACDILYTALHNALGGSCKTGDFDRLTGDVKRVKAVELIDQNPAGRSTRSNPVTYIKAYDDIRKLYSSQPPAARNGLTQSHFSFNLDGGRCEECLGEGFIKVEMQFMADVILQCETCGGKRFKENVLEVTLKDKNISDLLDMSIDEAIEFFESIDDNLSKKIIRKLTVLHNVGLGYVKMGQPSSTLSGGESQRVKLASFLQKESHREHTLFIFDEPTTGLHFHDIRKLMTSLNALVDNGHSVIVIEHNSDVIKCADRVIDLGPEGGAEGGYVVFEGTPEELLTCEQSYTGKYLKNKLK